MRTIHNKTQRPLRVPLPRGKLLHLGPGKSGQVAHQDLGHKPLQKLIKEGKIEVQDDGSGGPARPDRARAPHEVTHGHHPPTARQVKGDR